MLKLLPCTRGNALTSTALGFALLLATPAGAETITLHSLDGQFVLNGKIVEATGGTYVLKGALGELRVDADRVRCEGAACPDAVEPVQVAAEPEFARPVVPAAMPVVLSAAEPEPTDVVAATGPAPSDFAARFKQGLAAWDAFGATAGSASGPDPKRTVDAGGLVIATDVAAVTAKAAPLALVAGPLPKSDALSGLRMDTVAHDALAVLIHPSNPVRELTLDRLRDVYAGGITNWSELGGPDRPIRLIPLRDDATHRRALEAALFADELVIRVVGGPAVADPAVAVATDPLAIAFVPRADQGGSRTIDIIDACGSTSSPDLFSLKSGTYPLTVPVSLVSLADLADPALSEFLVEAQLPGADSVYRALGLIDREIISAPLADLDYSLSAASTTRREAQLLEEKRADIAKHDRLSATFYFPFGSTALDRSTGSDLTLLADHLSGLPAGTNILVVGFSDDVGQSKRNFDLSAERARNVAAALEEIGAGRLDGIEVASKGFGEIAPVACNDTEAGRSLNRRVEIWVQRPTGP
jgi:phosphate transport system substrate-binding protein